jgi:sugar phosphate isomerase/epimerase
MSDNLLGVSEGFFKEPAAEKWRDAVTAGITEVEISIPQGELDMKEAEQRFALITGSGARVSSVHLPFGDKADVSALAEPVRRQSIEDAKKILDWADKKQTGIAVIHPSYEPIDPKDRSERLSNAIHSLKELGDYAKAKNVILAVENLPRTCLGNCAGEMLLLTDNGRSASMCFDVNHLLIESHRDFFTRIAPYVVTTHLSDYDRINERHWLIGDGCIDWKELFGLFEKAAYKGRYIFELGEASSPKLGRPFSPAELVQRYKELAGK